MHWRSDILTPRGPSLDIRPRPEQCQAWLCAAGFSGIRQINVKHPAHITTHCSLRDEGDEGDDAREVFFHRGKVSLHGEAM